MTISLIDHNKRTKSLKTKGENLSTAIAEHFRDSVTLFYGEGNHNIQLINDCVDIAKVTKGMRVKGAVTWFKEMIPHVPADSGDFHFGIQIPEKRESYEESWSGFMEVNPHWADYSVETVQEDWTAIKYCKAQVKLMNSKHEGGLMTNQDFQNIKAFWAKFELDLGLDF